MSGKLRKLLITTILVISVLGISSAWADYHHLKIEYWDVTTTSWLESPTDPPTVDFTQSIAFDIKITARHEDDSIVAAGQGSNTTVVIECSDNNTSPSFSPPREESLINGEKIITVTLNTIESAQSSTTHYFDARDKNMGGIGHGRLYVKMYRFVDHFELTVPAGNQQAGVAFNLTVTAKDLKNVTAITFSDDVDLSAQVGEISPLVINKVAFVNGIANVMVTLYGADSITGYNVIYATNTVTYPGQLQAPYGQSDEIAVDPNVFNKILLLFPGETIYPGTIAGTGKQGIPTAQTAGNPFLNVKVCAVDQYWNPVNSGFPNISFTSSDVQAVLPAVMLMTDNPEVFNSITLKTRGNQWVRVQELTNLTVSQSNITINAAEIDHYIFNPIGSPQVTTTAFNITITAYDAYDNQLTGYNQNGVTLSASTGPGTITVTGVNFAAGIANANVNVTKSDVGVKLTVDDEAGHSSDSNAFNINYGVFSRLLVLLRDEWGDGEYQTPGIGTGRSGNVPDTFVAGVSTVTVKIIATDTYWNTIDDGSAAGTPINITCPTGYINSIDNGAVLPGGGEADYRVIFFTTSDDFYPYAHELQNLTVTGGGRTGTGSDVAIHAGDYEKLVLVAPNENLDPGSDPLLNGKQGIISDQESHLQFPVTIVGTDKYWNPIETTPYPTVLFTSGDVLAALPAGGQLLGSAVQNFSVKLGTLGNQTITVEDIFDAAKNDTVTIAVNHGALNSFEFSFIASPQTVNTAFLVTITAKDFNGNIITNCNDTIDFSANTGEGTFNPLAITFVAGVAANVPVTIFRAMEEVILSCNNGLGQVGNSSPFDVLNLPYTKVLILLDGEEHTPGVFPGKKNSATPPQAGDTVDVTVYAVDDSWNLVDTATPTIEIFTSDYSVIPSSSQVLVDGEGAFQIIYRTAGIQTTTAYDKAIPLRRDSSSIFINPAAYVGLQIIAPGEAADPGSTTGKTVALPINQNANQPFTVKVMGVDQYWNRVTDLNGKQIRLTASDASLDTIAPYTNPTNQNSPFVEGEMDFEIHLNSAGVVTLNASDFTDMTKIVGTVGINILAGYEYEIVITSPLPIIAGPPSIFAMTVRLLDGGGVPVAGANNGIILTPYLADYTSVSGDLGVTTAALNNGIVSISEQSYNLAETIRIKVTDDYGREKFSDPIVVKALGLYYDITVPDEVTVGPPEQFSMVVQLKDSSTGQIVTTCDRQVNIEIRSADTGAIGTGSLGVANDYLSAGMVNVTQSYTKAENVYFIISDTHTLSGSSKIFRVKADGYKKLQIIAPGEIANPGNSSATGKLALPDTQQAGLSFTVSVRAVDQYWNLAEDFNGDHIRLSSGDGSLDDNNPSNQGDLFVNGRVFFVVKLNNFGNIGITCYDQDNPSKPVQTVTIPVSYATYRFSIIPVNAPAGPPDKFTIKVDLIDGMTMAPLIANHTFTMEAVTAGYLPTTGILGVTEAVLDNGSVKIDDQSYNLVEDICIKITDEFGRVAYSNVISVIASSKKYEIFVPVQAMVGPPDTFEMVIELRDTQTGNLITTQDHNLNIDVYSSVNGLLATGNLGTTTALLQEGRVTIAQSYDNIENIFFRIWDPASLVVDTFSTDVMITAGLGTVLSLNVLSLTIEPQETVPIIATLEDQHGNKILNAQIDFRIMSGQASLNADFDLTNNLGEATVNVTCNKTAKDGYIVILVFTDQVSEEVTIQIHGVPLTTMSFLGVSSELTQTIHLKPDTPIVLSAVSRIGIDKIYYRIDGGLWQEYTGEFFISQIGMHTLEYYAVDQNGHQETMQVSKTIYISMQFMEINKAINYPNPFRAGKEPTFIEYNLTQSSNVKISIYDLLGQIVWEKKFYAGENGGQSGETNRVEWWGRNNLAEVVSNGGYICRIWIEAERKQIIRKIAVVK